jgi:hypothetical protein
MKIASGDRADTLVARTAKIQPTTYGEVADTHDITLGGFATSAQGAGLAGFAGGCEDHVSQLF